MKFLIKRFHEETFLLFKLRFSLIAITKCSSASFQIKFLQNYCLASMHLIVEHHSGVRAAAAMVRASTRPADSRPGNQKQNM
jgi:hypothetical protein